MSERFDDMIRKHFERLESPVPLDMFDAIRNHPDVSDAMFDAAVKNKLQPLESPVIAGFFEKINAGTDLTNAPFDDFVNQKLTTHQSPVPAGMWSRIMQEKHRRRPVAWWWIAAGLILLLLGGTWYAVQHSGNKKATVGKNRYSGTNNISPDPSASSDGVSVAEKPVSPFTEDTSQAALSVAQNPTAREQDAGTKAKPDNDYSLNSKANKKVVVPILRQQDTSETFSRNWNHKKETNLFGQKPDRTDAASESDPAILLNSNRDEKEEQNGNGFTKVNALRLAITGQLRNAAKLLPGQLLKAKSRLPEIPCPVNGSNDRNDWYIDIYSSAFLVQKKISDKTAGKNAKSGFDSTIHRQVSFNAGISLVKIIGSNILLKTGLQYNRLNESFRLTRINERKLVTTISVRTVIIAPGDTVYIRDTSVTEHIGTIQRRKQNRYQQWDVPVIIGYEFGGQDIRLNANAGIIANIRSSYAGEMLADTAQQIIDAKNYNGKPVYKTNVGISLYAGLSIVKPLGERTSLLIEPYARIGLQNVTTDNAWFRQKNSSAGISVGLRYQLNNNGQRR